MTEIQEVFKQAVTDLDAIDAQWAVIGGLAVATRATPRFTQDVDFAIEDQIVACADRLEIWPGVVVPVARAGHLVALKLLSRDERRLQDQLDLQALLAVAKPADLDEAHQAVALIADRGFNRERDLRRDLDDLVRDELGS